MLDAFARTCVRECVAKSSLLRRFILLHLHLKITLIALRHSPHTWRHLTFSGYMTTGLNSTSILSVIRLYSNYNSAAYQSSKSGGRRLQSTPNELTRSSRNVFVLFLFAIKLLFTLVIITPFMCLRRQNETISTLTCRYVVIAHRLLPLLAVVRWQERDNFFFVNSIHLNIAAMEIMANWKLCTSSILHVFNGRR